MKTLILAYHRVNDWSDDALTVHPKMFRKQMLCLAKRYRIVSLAKLVSARTEALPEKERLAAVTFDDGYFDNYLHARPILKELNLTATFFLTAGYVGTDHLLPRDEKNGEIERDRLLNWPEVMEMKNSGFSFGSHSLTHANLAAITPEQADREIRESKNILEAHLQEKIAFFCYPFGSCSPEVKKLTAKAGYQAAFRTPAFNAFSMMGKKKTPEDHYALKRVGIYHHTSLIQFHIKTS